MKVLYLAPYISMDESELLSRHKTGFGYMVKDIIESANNNGIDCYLSTQSYINFGVKFEKFYLVKRKLLDILINIRLKYFKLSFFFLKYNIPLYDKIRYFFYFLSGGYVEKVIKTVKPDIVHIHGLDFSTIPFVIACIECKKPFLLTLHGANSLSNTVKVNKHNKQLEQEFLILSENKNIKITVISSGLKRRFRNILKRDFKNIEIVTNGATISCNNPNYENQTTQKKETFISVGNISERKNQVQILKALSIIPQEIRSNVLVLFIGKDNTNGEFEQLVHELGLEENVSLVGPVDRNIVGKYYVAADYNITASFDEGFGLSIIEGFEFGLPTVCYSDIDAVIDLYDKNCMLLIDKHDDDSLAEVMLNCIHSNWNREYIKSYAEKFSLNCMSDKYLNIYNSELSNDLTVKDIKELLWKLDAGGNHCGTT